MKTNIRKSRNVFFKATTRAIDLLVSGAALITLSPLLLLLGALLRARNGAPVLFRQRRPGYRGRPFLLYKFRTMRDVRDAAGRLLPDADRLTAVGLLMRKLSLDELPQLWNVFKGDMSLVGPRPLLMEYLDRYTPEQRRRHDVKPGITGWAQVNGRNAIGWEEKFALDVWYVDHASLALNVKILWLTLLKTVRREDISARDHVTMPEFRGTELYKSLEGPIPH